jgi:putative membrane protein
MTKRIVNQFTDAERKRVAQAITEAESKTSAEIMPVIAASSGRYDRPEDIVGLWFAVVGITVVWLLLPTEPPESGSWDGGGTAWQWLALVGVTVVGFIAGAWIGSQVGWLRRLFTPRPQMHEEVFSRARQVFFDNRVYRTLGASGVLLYVSLFERMAAIIADQRIIESLGQPAIDQACAEFTRRLREGSPIDALCTTATTLGQRLSAPLPRATDDVNELSDALVVLDEL